MTTDSRGRLLRGKGIAAQIRAEVAAGTEALVAAGGRRPKLVAILVGGDTASATYVESKTRGCRDAGLLGETLHLDEGIDQQSLENEVRRLNEDDSVDGILVQLPLPGHLDQQPILEMVDPAKDVDGFHPENVGRLWLGQETLAPATPSGVIESLRRTGVEMSGKHAVVVGRSNIVGKPMAGLLLQENCTVTVCHSRTQDLPAVCRQADILIVAVGRTAMIGPEHVKEGAVVIDVGMNRVDDVDELERLYPGNAKRKKSFEKRGFSLVGDVDFRRTKPQASAITPVPGGVGLLTVAMVLANTLKASRRRQGIAG